MADLMESLRDSLERARSVHWVGDAPTSLHGNGATSFKRTTRFEGEVTCRLCLTLLTREAIERGDLAVDHAVMYDTHPTEREPEPGSSPMNGDPNA